SLYFVCLIFFSSRRRHTISKRDWSSDVCSSDLHIIQRYEDHHIERERVLIKIAATWEGIEAARQLQAEGINCNLTLLFSMPQAVACAQAKVTLISPFVGRIYDWYKKNAADQWDEAANAGPNDPGVQSVERIYNYYKIYDINTEIM